MNPEQTTASPPGAPRTVFYTCCDTEYEDFVALYALSAVAHNDDVAVEVGVADPSRFMESHGRSWEPIWVAYRDRIRLRTVQPALSSGEPVPWNCVRFVTEPLTASTYVYITDVDIITLDRNVTKRHLKNMARLDRTYSNIVRPGTTRMTGLHFCVRNIHYPVPDISELPVAAMNDEMVLYEIVKRRGIPIHDDERQWRPVHGIHVSPNREPMGRVDENGTQRPGWGILAYAEQYRAFRANPVFRDIRPHFSERIRGYLAAIDDIVD